MKIYLSGTDSGPNPAPGIGLARSLRRAYPNADLIAVDYAQTASGFHSPVFDDVLLFRPWDELDLKRHATQIEAHLDGDSWWIPTIDTEIELLAEELGTEESFLGPRKEAYIKTRKPGISAAKRLPATTPPAIPAFEDDRILEDFCQHHDWKVWVKGPKYDAKSATNWEEVKTARKSLGNDYHPRRVFVQSHVEGEEFSVPFVAVDGRLLHALQATKSVRTEEGNTWTGQISPLPEELYKSLEAVVDDLAWTGGGELEFIRDPDDSLHLIEWNPRFPAWIHGATVTGHNLPARLLATVSGNDAKQFEPVREEADEKAFTRIVQERRTRKDYPVPDSDQTSPFDSTSTGKFDAVDSEMAVSSEELPTKPPKAAEETTCQDIQTYDTETLSTPERVPLRRSTDEAFRAGEQLQETISEGVDIEIAYSVKTNPDKRLLDRARERGFFAEVISGEELEWTREMGFEPDSMVVNGPEGVYDLLEWNGDPVSAVFADSVQAFQALLEKDHPPAETIGIRIQHPDEGSRFGIPINEYKRFVELLESLDQFPTEAHFGIHMHIQSSRVGSQRWFKLVRALLDIVHTFEAQSPVTIQTLDFGGGWTPQEFQETLAEPLRQVCMDADRLLPNLERILLEPGKALARDSAGLLTEVVEVRSYGNHREVIVDAAISDLPRASDRPHPVLLNQNGEWVRIRTGGDKLLGRICLETDVLADGLHFPSSISAGDRLVILEAGAYNTSMSYEFGKGGKK